MQRIACLLNDNKMIKWSIFCLHGKPLNLIVQPYEKRTQSQAIKNQEIITTLNGIGAQAIQANGALRSCTHNTIIIHKNNGKFSRTLCDRTKCACKHNETDKNTNKSNAKSLSVIVSLVSHSMAKTQGIFNLVQTERSLNKETYAPFCCTAPSNGL